MICNTDKEKRAGTTEQQSIQESFIRGKRMGKVDSIGKMAAITKEILLTGPFKEKANIISPIWTSGTKESSE